MYVGDCNKCIYGYKCPCGKSLNSAACLSIAKKGKPKQTNADRIRSMSDEELSKFIGKFLESMSDCENCPAKTEVFLCFDCADEILDWLRKEVEE